jgi:hypothetical protein
VEILRVRRPFWTHQIVEYLIGIVLISAAIQQPQPMVPALLGLAIVLNAAVAKGAAGAFRLVGHRLHRRLDIAVMVLLVVGAVQPWVSLDNTSRFILGAIAFVMFFVWFHTDFTERVPRTERRRRAAASGDAGSTAGGYTSESIGRGAGRLAGKGVNSVKRWKDGLGGDG